MTTSSIDLHLHSNYSDGLGSPQEIVQIAAERGVTTIAITDYENANGARAAVPAAAEANIELIPAIKITCRWDRCPSPSSGGDYRVLGYFIDLDDTRLKRAEQALLGDTHGRITDCCARLTADGYPLEITEVFEFNQNYAGSTALVQTILKKEFAKDLEGALNLFLHHWRFVRQSGFTIQRAIEIIHNAGGVAVLAHPVIYECNGTFEEKQFKMLVDQGLDGVEIFHPRHNERVRKHFTNIANRLGLVVTGGSEEHGYGERYERMGSQMVTPDVIESLRIRQKRRR